MDKTKEEIQVGQIVYVGGKNLYTGVVTEGLTECEVTKVNGTSIYV